ncbi:MAG: phosphate-starvation-inducible PsiE family protein [Bacteroidales bacterium]|nr:phosphate-starvation-inducible PsiE family protein [Bacteroidales bacterium]
MQNNNSILSYINKIEKLILIIIVVIFSFLLLLSLIDIVYEIIMEVRTKPFLIIKADNLMDLFSVFLIVLIGLELLETIKAYLRDDILHVELVLLLAIIAVSRKVIVWNFDKYDTWELIGLAIMVIALSFSYFLLKLKVPKKRGIKKNNPDPAG